MPWAKTVVTAGAASQSPGGEVIDGAAPAVRCGDPVVNEPLVEGKVWERPVFGVGMHVLWQGCCFRRQA